MLPLVWYCLSDVRLRLFDMQSLVAKIAYYNHGRHDHYLNPLFFTLKIAGALGAFALFINYMYIAVPVLGHALRFPDFIAL